MAQSQVPFTYLNDGQEIINHLSDKRFGTYLQRAGFNKDYAFELYLYNARLAKAFLFPLQILEVTVRNNGLSAVYEPSTKTSIKAGETVTIECPTNTVKQTVLGNIKQFKALGKNVEVLNGRS